MTITATLPASATAQIHSQRVTRRCAALALIGNANSSDVTSSACTSSTEPRPSAAACSENPTAATTLPSHHWRSRSSRRNSCTWPTDSSATSCAERWWMTSPIAMKKAAPSASRAAMSALAINASWDLAERGRTYHDDLLE